LKGKKLYRNIFIGLCITLFAFKADDYFEISKNLDIFATIYREVNTTYVVDLQPGELIRSAIDGMLKALDPYTVFYSEAQAEDYRFQTTGTYAGIGASVRTRNGKVYIDRVFEDYPAQKAGIFPGDIILKIDDQLIDPKKNSDISALLKGNAGTKVNILIERPAVGEMLKTLEREKITQKNVTHYSMIDDQVGYIKLATFMPNATNDVVLALRELKGKGATKLVLDLRDNGGGLLMEAMGIVNIFVGKANTVVETRGRQQEKPEILRTINVAEDPDIPLVVLINGRSASASEIVSGGLQDYDRAVIIGQKSFGKGLVQTTKSLKYGTSMKITTAKYYLPSGRLIQKLNYDSKVHKGTKSGESNDDETKFYTTNKRVVTGGDGITPDINIAKNANSKILQSLTNNYLISEFANNFRVQNERIDSANSFTLSIAIFNSFKDFLKDKEYTYETNTEKILQKLIEESKSDQYFELVSEEITDLEKKLAAQKKNDLNLFEEEIKEALALEIIQRYYYESGLIVYGLNKDEEVKKAVSILYNQNEYKQILGF
jgi:carboxyl-terminal processing protease